MLISKIDFSNLKDPRNNKNKKHALIDIIKLVMCAVLSGCNDWNEIEEYGLEKFGWLKTFIEFANGVPSHDTINRVFSLLEPRVIQECFLEWVKQSCALSGDKVINIDGKRLCNSGTGGKASIVHLVQAWSSELSLCLGQVKTEDKSNEITAIPELLDILDLKGNMITIDAMGCQEKIATKIKEKKGDYLLAVKDNQKFLHDDLREGFKSTPVKDMEVFQTIEKRHGCIETRTCSVLNDLDWVCDKDKWSGLKSLIRIEAEKTNIVSGMKQQEVRYYISSRGMSAQGFNEIVRGHWGIENKLHWVLDVVFKEDLSTKQAGNAAQNFSIISKIALHLLKKEQAKKTSLKNKRLICGWNNKYLIKVLFEKV